MGVWIGGVWNGRFPESEKYFSEAEFSRQIPEIPQKERFSPNFRLRDLKIQSPKNCNLHTPSHSIPPLDSLLMFGTSFPFKHRKVPNIKILKRRGRPLPSDAPGLHALLNYFGINFRFDYTYTYTFTCFGN